ncbi:DUF6221 family protein [Micromonospora sp. NPDC048935]|uniref:DUF6221 family protein n=1 Tax=Micromonospora sp. NPDC048935 TaxID=3364262 RepID=UPI0037195999
MNDLTVWLDQQLENRRHTAEALKTLAAALPVETAALLTEAANLLLADVDSKRHMLDTVHPEVVKLEDTIWSEFSTYPEPDVPELLLKTVGLSYAGLPGYRPEWGPQ